MQRQNIIAKLFGSSSNEKKTDASKCLEAESQYLNNPSDVDARNQFITLAYELGNLLVEKKDFVQAEKYFKKADEAAPNEHPLKLNLATKLFTVDVSLHFSKT